MMIVMFGTIVNFIAVILGSILGVLIHSRLPDKIKNIAFQSIGIFTLFLGINMGLKTANFLIMVFSIVSGAIIGEMIDIDRYVNSFGEWLKKKIRSKNELFAEGFVTAFLLFCMGSMTILGSIEEGISGIPNLLLSKSILDGFSSIALASSLGIGVMFSALPLLAYQGALTLFASYLKDVLDPMMINEVTAVGGLLLIGLGINIIGLKKIKIINMLPSLIIAGILSIFFS